ncbi:MAG: aminoacyl-histidine dipeptidase [Bacteroidetes bacterium]|nr:aminoacyl-histidine dipeptidase [Bacteroidota bacterium]MBL6963863.1 aminoacyl-histidine dipeptidase [Bacteroidota bacterium]
MNNEILNLQPKELWKHFYSLTQIPRPSKKEERIIEFIKKFGEDLGLETIVDKTGNVIIKKPATPGMEDKLGVVLQGHLDMVPQKNSDKVHDFEKDPIETIVDGEWVRANGTTLGSDNGMGVAATMAVLESTDMIHPAIEGLFTIDEETGMTGAFGLEPGILNGDILINMDSEDEGELYVGCAGGMDAEALFTYSEEIVPSNYTAFDIKVTGMKGGHSGIDIPLGRGNSNKVLNRFLWTAQRELGLRVAKLAGGSLRNAIPRESFATVVVPSEKTADLRKSIDNYSIIAKAELSVVEPDMKFELIQTELPSKVMKLEDQTRVLNAAYACPHGVMRMSDGVNVPETSTNMAIYNIDNGKAEIVSLMRSSVDSAKIDLSQRMTALLELAGAKVTLKGEYPGWKPNMDSPILKTMSEVYHKKYGKIPEVKVIHAGLECGILGNGYPNWDMISFGPTIRFPHSPDEKVNIETVDKFWNFLVETLKAIPKK